MAEDRLDNNAGRAVERVIIAEAAALLGCHPNTVRNRVKAGMYHADKVHTENGPTWMIERDSLTTNAPTSASQQGVSGVPAAQQEDIQELAKAIVREAGLGPSPEDATAKRRDLVKASAREFDAGMAGVYKHTGTLSAASIVGVVAMFGAFKPEPSREFLYGFFGYGLVALVYTLIGAATLFCIISSQGARFLGGSQSMDSYEQERLDSYENLAELEDVIKRHKFKFAYPAFSLLLCWVLGLIVCLSAIIVSIVNTTP